VLIGAEDGERPEGTILIVRCGDVGGYASSVLPAVPVGYNPRQQTDRRSSDRARQAVPTRPATTATV
jgi:hypothetical protein